MHAVAKRRSLRLLALTQGDLFVLRQRKLYRRESGAAMGPITERLALRASASTPVIGAWPQAELRGDLGWDDGLFHTASS